MNAIVRTIRNLVANSIAADRGPSGQHVGQHLHSAAQAGAHGTPLDVAVVAWEHLAPLVDVDVEWLDHPTWHQWESIIDAAKSYLAKVGHLEFAHYANGKSSMPTRIVEPPDVRIGAWIRRVRNDCVRLDHDVMSISYRASTEWGPAFHQVASVRSAYPATVLADALDGREPQHSDRKYLFLGTDGRPLTGFTFPVSARMPIEMIA